MRNRSRKPNCCTLKRGISPQALLPYHHLVDGWVTPLAVEVDAAGNRCTTLILAAPDEAITGGDLLSRGNQHSHFLTDDVVDDDWQRGWRADGGAAVEGVGEVLLGSRNEDDRHRFLVYSGNLVNS